MANDGEERRPVLASWAQVDPARYPFDPSEVPALVGTVTLAVGGSERWEWIEAVSAALADRYGPWAYHWYWGPGAWDQRGSVTNRVRSSAEAPAVVAESLLTWRSWLEKVAERIDRFRSSLDPAAADLVATWEAAAADLMRTTVAPVVDDDGWQGWCQMALQWLLTSAGIPAELAQALVNDAIDKRFYPWAPLTADAVVDIAERLTRNVLRTAGVAQTDNWPDTWPQNWPAWRASNTTGYP